MVAELSVAQVARPITAMLPRHVALKLGAPRMAVLKPKVLENRMLLTRVVSVQVQDLHLARLRCFLCFLDGLCRLDAEFRFSGW